MKIDLELSSIVDQLKEQVDEFDLGCLNETADIFSLYTKCKGKIEDLDIDEEDKLLKAFVFKVLEVISEDE